MDTTITFLKKQFTLRPSEQDLQGKVLKKIIISHFKGAKLGYVWKDNAKDSGVWLYTHSSTKHPLTKHDLYILNEVMTKFNNYWSKINKIT